MRKVLSETQIDKQAAQKMNDYHPGIVEEVEQAVRQNEWVVIGMTQNPVVKKARMYLGRKNITFKYIEHGSYFSKWKERLAIKLWSGWPTFPQVFHNGKLVGGFEDLQKYLNS
jgi:monothiol glutaredoxin